MTYFAMWGLTVYLVFNLRRLAASGALRKGLLLVAVALVMGVAMGCIQFLPTYYYTTNFSPRTGGVTFEFASSWSLHPEEIVSLLTPAFVGYNVGSTDSYWGRNPFKLNAESPGPLVLLLAIGGFVLLARRREAWPWLFLFIFCPLYALGAHTPLLKAAFYAIPGAKFLRAPSIIMFMFSCFVERACRLPGRSPAGQADRESREADRAGPAGAGGRRAAGLHGGPRRLLRRVAGDLRQTQRREALDRGGFGRRAEGATRCCSRASPAWRSASPLSRYRTCAGGQPLDRRLHRRGAGDQPAAFDEVHHLHR